MLFLPAAFVCCEIWLGFEVWVTSKKIKGLKCRCLINMDLSFKILWFWKKTITNWYENGTASYFLPSIDLYCWFYIYIYIFYSGKIALRECGFKFSNKNIEKSNVVWSVLGCNSITLKSKDRLPKWWFLEQGLRLVISNVMKGLVYPC